MGNKDILILNSYNSHVKNRYGIIVVGGVRGVLPDVMVPAAQLSEEALGLWNSF